MPSRLPQAVVRNAAELMVARSNMNRLLTGDPASGPAIKDYLIRLARAKGVGKFFHQVPAAPQMGMNRPVTVLVMSCNGAYRATVLPNEVEPGVAEGFAQRADGGLLDRMDVWGDPRYIGLVSQCFGPDGANAWWTGPEDDGVVARAAWAALILEGLRRHPEVVPGLEGHLHDNLFKVTRDTIPGGPARTFSSRDDPYARCWTVADLDAVLEERGKTILPSPKPLLVPLEVFRHRGNLDLGYGEVIAYWLTLDPRGPGVSQAEAAFNMGLDDRKMASALARAAREKLGSKKSLFQLIPAWPAGSQSSKDLRGDASAKLSRSKKRSPRR